MRFVDASRVRTQFDVRLPTHDGIELSVDIYRPARQGSYPVLVTRTASDNNRASWAPSASTAPSVPADRWKLIAEHGFIVIAADVRGRGDSDGIFTPFVHEAQDGAELIEWARRLPDGNGQIGAFGAGYAGFAALAAAQSTTLDALAVWSPFGIADIPTRGGAVRLDWLFWQHLVGGRSIQPADVPPWSHLLRHRPLRALDQALGRSDIAWAEWMDHLDPEDPYWTALDIRAGIASPETPLLFVSGWWDPALSSTLAYWEASLTTGTNSHRELLIGPWDAAAVRHPSLEVGGVAWGPSSIVDHDQLLVEWFQRQFSRDRDEGFATPVRVFLTGRNEWCDLASWPTAQPGVTLWPVSGGRANSRIGDGRLLAAPAEITADDSFAHNPNDPVPWQPDGVTFSRSTRHLFSLDTAFATGRDDVLVYTSPPCSAPQRYLGPPVVFLRATTNLQDADWHVALEDVFPGDGRTVQLAHGVVRAATVTEFAPDRPTDYRIPLTTIAHELQPGHALRLVISASRFPLYAVNPGTKDYAGTVEATAGHQIVHHGKDSGTRIELPLIPSLEPEGTK